MGRKIRVGLIYGGRSGEHEVSLQTALSVARAFDYDRYELIPFLSINRENGLPAPRCRRRRNRWNS